MLPKEATINTQCEPQLEFVNCAEVSNMMKTEICSNGESNLLNYNNLKMDKANSSAPCVLNVDIEKGRPESEKSKSIDESVVNLKHDDSLARELLTEFILWVRGKFVQPMMNHRPETDRVYDKPTNGSRKFKRSALFNSRRVFLLFSALSSVGTMILIYLTLRMRPTGDVSGTVITSGNATRQYGEGGFPSKANCSKAVTSSADTMTNPCRKTYKGKSI